MKMTGSRWCWESQSPLFSCIGCLSVDLRKQQHLAAFRVTKQPSLGTAVLAPHGEGPRKGGLNKTCLQQRSALMARELA